MERREFADASRFTNRAMDLNFLGAFFMAIDLDDSRFPFIVVTFNGPTTDESFEAYLQRLTDVSMRDGPKAFLFDATLSEGAPPSQRKRMAQWMMQDMRKARGGFACVAFVFSSAVSRGVLTAILWLAPLRLRHGIFAERKEAEAFCLAQIAAREARAQARATPAR